MTTEDFAADAALFARLRGVWDAVDPVPADLVDRMVAAVAVADLSREYALLTLVESEQLAAVRSDTDTSTLQFSDGETTVLLHVTKASPHVCRIDGWVDAPTVAVRLAGEGDEQTTDVTDHGRFSFATVESGLWRLRLTVKDATGQLRDFQTPHFEV